MGDIVNYYDRTAGRNSDGTPVFSTESDRANQIEAATAFVRWLGTGSEVKEFGKLCPIDYYSLRHGRMDSVLEVKCRTHEVGRYETVFLNVRKWLALQMASVAFGIPAYFVVRFTDGIRHIDLGSVDASRHRIAGTTRKVKSHTDQEPVIDVPVHSMREIDDDAGH